MPRAKMGFDVPTAGDAPGAKGFSTVPITHSGPVIHGQLSVIRSLPRYVRVGQGDLANLIHVWLEPY
jgi:hypothetical protein